MSIEAALAELTAAVKENTAVHREFAEIARKAATGKSSGEAAADTAADEAAAKAEAEKKAEAAEKKKAAAAKKKAEEEAAKKAAEAEAEAEEDEAEDETEAEAEIADWEVVTEISEVDLRALAKEFMSADDEDERDANKANFVAALKHIGAKQLSQVSDDEDRAKLATYIKAWQADPKAKLRDIDSKIEDAMLA